MVGDRYAESAHAWTVKGELLDVTKEMQINAVRTRSGAKSK
jgi:hypothetical protein